MYKALQLGYMRGQEDRQARKLKRYGYVLDKELTNGERMVAYNPFNGKVIFVENGSETNVLHPKQLLEDWQNNIQNVSTGTFGYTPRFQDAKSAYLKAKQKYKEAPINFVAHSQSAITANELVGKGDKGYTYNGALIKQKDNPNVTNYRTAGDIVSAFANPNDMKTIQAPAPNQGIFAAHAIDNIKQLPVFI